VAIAASTIVIGHKRERNQKQWMANFLERRNKKHSIPEEVKMYSCAPLRNFTSMTASDFELLPQWISPSIKKEDTNMTDAIPISMHLAVTSQF
jgi:hypothetical protein